MRKYITNVGKKKWTFPHLDDLRIEFRKWNKFWKQSSSWGWLFIIQHLVFYLSGTVWWNSYCPERVYARGHTREHGVKKYRGQCIRLFSNTKKPYTPFDTPAPTVSLTVKNWKEPWRTRKYFSNVGEKKWNFPRPYCYLSPPFFETVILLRVARNLSSSFCSSRYRVVKLILSWSCVCTLVHAWTPV